MLFRKFLIFVFVLIFFQFIFWGKALAVYDPSSLPNNFVGIHILFPSELNDAANLVNSSGGDWGYITIPIQSGDRDLEKWQKFMDEAKKLHLIPIIRLSTEEDPFRKGVWRKPDFFDIVDFSNFLNSLSWPTKNRYVILFNEINRFDEWGGEKPDPSYYSQIVSFSYTTFKERNDEFFIILGGLDNASPSDGNKYMSNFDYLNQLVYYDPEIFNKIDGFSSHSYPNPGFVQAPSSSQRMSISTYKYEYNFINSRSNSKKYAFITETGWNSNSIPESVVASYYKHSFENIWKQDSDKIIAITPFLLRSNGGPFDMFSFYKNGRETSYYEEVKKIAKIKGEPQLSTDKILGMETDEIIVDKKKFNKVDTSLKEPVVPPLVKEYFKLLIGLN